MQGSDPWEPQLSWGGVSLRTRHSLMVESVMGEPWGRAMCQCRGPMGQCPCPDKELEQSVRRSELTVGCGQQP